MSFLGIDPSLSGSGLLIIEDDYTLLSKDKFSTPVKGVERLYHLELKLQEYLDVHSNIEFVCIEGPALRETGRIFDLGQWAGILYLTLYKISIPFIIVAPLQLKKYVSLIGKNKGKNVVMLDIYKYFNIEIRDDDLADAYVLARIAHDYHKMFVQKQILNLKKARMEVLNKLYETNTKIKKEILL